MKLSASEKQFVKRWQKHRRTWLWLRWFCLIFSICLILLAGLNLHRLLDLAAAAVGAGDAAAIGWFAPFAWFTLLAPSGLLGYTLGKWRGDIKTELLLRLIAEHEKQDA